jgi:holliday junction DNA helicase RuvA
MIGSIKGKIIFKTDKFLIIETVGVGYKINVSPETLSKAKKLGDEIMLWTHTHVREDVLDLYGFLDREELEFFEMLINISGIGPRSALAILGIASIETLRKAIGMNDISYLTKISGIGKKTAERIVIELRDKIGTGLEGSSLQEELDVLEALKSLGYSQNEAREALKKVSEKNPADIDTNLKIREALKILGSHTKGR